MREQEEDINLLREYLGFGGRSLVIFLAATVGTVAVVTCIYTSIFGYESWSNNMEQAGSLMLSGMDAPVADPAAPPTGGAQAVPAATTGGCQLQCPSCGVVDFPIWSTTGDPMCPKCGVLLDGIANGAAQLAANP